MRKNTLTIDIKKPVDAVFKFTIKEGNTPKWIPSVLKEKISQPVVKVGTIYYLKVADGKKQRTDAFIVTGFIKNKRLDFHLVNGKYTCSYTYEKISVGTRLTYSEENGVDGEIESPMNMKNLQTLKKLVEDT